jgi:hypothetical protein
VWITLRQASRLVVVSVLATSALAATVGAAAHPGGGASPCSLPVSGATQSIPANKNDGNPQPVPVPDDGAVRAGAAFDFTDNGDGTVTDNNTGLMWENKTIGGLHDKEKTLRWSGDGSQETVWDWLDDVNAEAGTGFAGHNDWRLPNIKELQSIRNYGGGSAPAPFNVKESYYWSSTTVHYFPGSAWTVFMTGGGDMIIYDKAGQEFYAIAVRGPVHGAECLPETGQTRSYEADKNDGVAGAVPVPDDGAIRAGRPLDYRSNGDGTVTDVNTGLTWEEKTDDNGLHDQDNVYHWSGDGTQETVWDWLDDVNAESGTGFAGHRDWRIPNVKELISIMDYGEADPSIDKAFSRHCGQGRHARESCTMPAKYWTGTGPTFAQFGVSYVVRDAVTSQYFVRAVRGGRTAGSPAARRAAVAQPPAPALATTMPVGGAASRLPVTGWSTQVPANKNDGNPAPVAVPDDGTLQEGQPFSFTDNGDGTITDNVTGLMWEKKSNDGGLHDQDNVYRWSGDGSQETIWDWLDDVNAESFAGYDDWRIPNVKELQSIIHFGRRAPSAHPAFNINCTPGGTVVTGSCTPLSWVWSSTSMEGWPAGAWMIAMGGVGHVYLGDKVQPLSVRAVRGGNDTLPATGQKRAYKADKNDGDEHAVPVPDDGTLRTGRPLGYVDNGDGTVTDINTGLMWEDKDNGGGLHDKDNLYAWSGNGSQETIWDWLDDVNAESFAGYDDWRIPNVKELLSLVDYGRRHPSIDPVFTASPSSHRTGTAISPVTTWHVGYDFGWISREVIDLPLSVRAVRHHQGAAPSTR